MILAIRSELRQKDEKHNEKPNVMPYWLSAEQSDK